MACSTTYCADSNCSWKHPFNRFKRNRCNAIKQCISANCVPMNTYGPSGAILAEACSGHCHLSKDDALHPDSHANTNEYLCSAVDPILLVDYYGVNPCGVPLEETEKGKLDEKRDKEAANNNQVLYIAIGGFFLLAGALVLLIFGNKK